MSRRTSPVPYASMDGELMLTAGKRSRQIVLDVFEMIGGVERMAEWASENPDDFYTKLFTKTITREADINHHVGVEDLLDELAEAEASGMVLEGEYEELTSSEEE